MNTAMSRSVFFAMTRAMLSDSSPHATAVERLLSTSRHILKLVAITAIAAFATDAGGATFAGMPVAPGATVRANVPLSALQQRYVAEGGNTVPPHAVAVIAVPGGFDPQKSWPVLVVFSTSDMKIQNRDDLERIYRPMALAEGWVVIAGDGPAPAKQDSSGWRIGMTLAALDAMHRSFPGSEKWPMACAGFSGGAKRTGLLGPLLAVAGYRISGLYMTGLNDDTLSQGYAKYNPGPAFLRTKVFFSSGTRDTTSPFAQQNAVRASMQRTGFTNIRHETFIGRHAVKRTHVTAALRWFRE
jgi:hypothetical protein